MVQGSVELLTNPTIGSISYCLHPDQVVPSFMKTAVIIICLQQFSIMMAQPDLDVNNTK
jgi:hypothetical protein